MTFRVDTAKFGDTLPNGATFIGCRRRAPGEYIILANYKGEFVTWAATPNGDTFWGRYFQTHIVDAVSDFQTR